MQKKKGTLEKLIEKRFPRLYSKWNNLPIQKSKTLNSDKKNNLKDIEKNLDNPPDNKEKIKRQEYQKYQKHF